MEDDIFTVFLAFAEHWKNKPSFYLKFSSFNPELTGWPALWSELNSALEPDWLTAAGAYPGFYIMKLLEVFLLLPDGMLVHRRSLPANLLGFPTIR